MKNPKWKFWLNMALVVMVAAEGLMQMWQPLLPPGVFAGIATVVAIGRAIAQFTVSAATVAEQLEEGTAQEETTHDVPKPDAG